MGWSSVLRSGKCDAATMQEGLEVIERSCKAQAQLIEDVLDISRIVSGKMRLEICPCKLVDVINAAIDVVRPAADAKEIRFETDLDPAASQASCDMTRMQQVVWNLLTNAIKFSAKGTLVRISLTREKPSTARLDHRQGRASVGPSCPMCLIASGRAIAARSGSLAAWGLGFPSSNTSWKCMEERLRPKAPAQEAVRPSRSTCRCAQYTSLKTIAKAAMNRSMRWRRSSSRFVWMGFGC